MARGMAQGVEDEEGGTNSRLSRLLNTLFDRGALRRWSRAAHGAETVDLVRLRRQRARARILRHILGEHLAVAEARLARPHVGSGGLSRPHGTDWSWRPVHWLRPLPLRGVAGVETRGTLGPGLTVFHDCRVSELTLRQVSNGDEGDLAPFGLRLDVFRFDGSFLSVVLDLPPEAAQGLQLRHLIRLDVVVEVERPIEIFARLNVRHGPNEEQVLRALPPCEPGAPRALQVEFDLAYTKLNERRVERLWLDLILEGPEMNQVTLRDLTLLRHPRADI